MLQFKKFHLCTWKMIRGRGTSFFPVKHEKLPPSYFQDAKNFSAVKPLNSGEARASPASPVPRPLPTTHESCKGRCWTSYDPQASCQCNSICRVHGNCCLDINLCPIEACEKLCIWDNCTMMQNERLVYGWRKIMENITCGYGHHE